MFHPSVKVIADSISPEGKRLTSLQVETHRFVLAEFNTHRAFSRNSASSRAIPYRKMRAKALEHTAFPLVWPSEQKGMQGGQPLTASQQELAEMTWQDALLSMLDYTDRLFEIGVHKSLINRLIEPFISHTLLITATEWDNFFAQRCHPDAQPEIRIAAELMQKAMEESTPLELGYFSWHVPYVDDHERIMASNWIEHFKSIEEATIAVSIARCARVSYETQEGVRDIEKDFDLFFRLRNHFPVHASPFEHVAKPKRPGTINYSRNFIGWDQYRGVLDL